MLPLKPQQILAVLNKRIHEVVIVGSLAHEPTIIIDKLRIVMIKSDIDIRWNGAMVIV